MHNMKKYMKVGLVHFMAYPQTIKGDGPILETLRKTSVDDYFDVVEITHINGLEVRVQAKNILAAAHLTVAFGGQPLLLIGGLNINDLDASKRQKAVDVLKTGIDEAYEMGAVGFAFLSGKYDEAAKEQAFAALVKSTQELCAYAQSKGSLEIVHEVFDYDVDKKSLVGPVAMAKCYAEEVKKKFKNFGLMIDLSHLPLLHETPEEAIVPIKEHIVHVHIGNCVVRDSSAACYGDQHPRFGFSGGENDINEVSHFLKVLLDIGYLNEQNPGILSFEVKPCAGEDSDVVVANAKRVLNRAWAMLK